MIAITIHTEKPFFADVKDDEAEYKNRVVATLANLAAEVAKNGIKKCWIVDKDSAGDGVIGRLIINEDPT